MNTGTKVGELQYNLITLQLMTKSYFCLATEAVAHKLNEVGLAADVAAGLGKCRDLSNILLLNQAATLNTILF